ncbi:hypothetical protein [Bacillus sp. FJAT-45066]|uniref:hypothetical protein n=1 Tax=Bacillus sp. FJAT-45066 TaxID=2011010 RepID=UPI000BB6B393|nr:hypothetical protein [Bacillus sp. FJAT-45066]
MQKGIFITLSIGLAVSLIANYNLSKKVNTLDDELRYNIRNLDRVTEQLQQQQYYIEQAFYEFKESNSWIAEEHYVPNENLSTPSSLHFDYEVTLREVGGDSTVQYQYRVTGDEDWKISEMRRIGDATFTVPIVLAPTAEYEFQLVEKGSSIKTGAVATIPSEYYYPSPVMIMGSGSSLDHNDVLTQIDMELEQWEVLFEFFEAESVSALLYNGNELTRTVPLRKRTRANGGNTWRLNLHNPNATSILIEVIYKDGREELLEAYSDRQ